MKKLFTVRSSVITGVVLLSGLMFAEAEADVSAGITSFSRLIDTFTDTVIKSTATLMLSLALLAFFYGLVEYIWAKRQGNGDKVKAGNDFMTWGLVALFVMFSVYGIIKFAQQTIFKGENFETITIPNINFKAKSNTGQNTNQGPLSPGATVDPSTPGRTECFSVVNGTRCSGGLGSCQNGACIISGSEIPGNTTPSAKGKIGDSCLYMDDCSGTLVCGDSMTCEVAND